jgi:hypothetical protein
MTNIAKHTPGPWIYSYSPYHSQENEEIPAFEVHGAEKVCDTNENRPYTEQEANARLIAAALPMLSLLKRINVAFYVKGTRKALVEVMKEAKPLIASAEGR